MNFPKIIIALAATAALVACGGGDESAPVADTAPGATTPGATTPATGASSGGESAGSLQLTVFTPQLTTSPSSGTVAYDAATKKGSISFKVGTADQTVSTTDGYDNVVNFSGFAGSGALRANGNLLMLCPAPATQETSTHLVLSNNLTRVTDASVLRGKSFTLRDCGGSPAGALTFNADGTATDPDGGTISAADVAAISSEAGWNWTDGSATGNIKASTYSFNNSAGQTRYYFLIQDKEGTHTTVSFGEQR